MRALILALGLLLYVGQASAANAYKFYDLDVENAPAVLAATDAFMKSETGQRFKGALHLNTYLANGASPATPCLCNADAEHGCHHRLGGGNGRKQRRSKLLFQPAC